jgi:hypothetical protein
VVVGADFPDVRGCRFAAAVHRPPSRHRRHRQ